MTDTTDLSGVSGPGNFMASVTVGAVGNGGIALLHQGTEETLNEDCLLLFMAGPTIRKWQALSVRPVIHTIQIGMAINTGEVFVWSAFQMVTGDI